MGNAGISGTVMVCSLAIVGTVAPQVYAKPVGTEIVNLRSASSNDLSPEMAEFLAADFSVLSEADIEMMTRAAESPVDTFDYSALFVDDDTE